MYVSDCSCIAQTRRQNLLLEDIVEHYLGSKRRPPGTPDNWRREFLKNSTHAKFFHVPEHVCVILGQVNEHYIVGPEYPTKLQQIPVRSSDKGHRGARPLEQKSESAAIASYFKGRGTARSQQAESTFAAH